MPNRASIVRFIVTAEKSLYATNENDYHQLNFSTCPATVKSYFQFFNKTESVKLAIAPDVLAVLVEKGELRATDFRCLDLVSKQIVWKMFLSLAAAKLSGRQTRHT